MGLKEHEESVRQRLDSAHPFSGNNLALLQWSARILQNQSTEIDEAAKQFRGIHDREKIFNGLVEIISYASSVALSLGSSLEEILNDGQHRGNL